VSVRVIEGSNSLVLPWKLQLYEKTFSGGPAASGTERVVSQPLVVGGLVIFTSFIPDEDICAGSGETWVFAVDFKSGLAPTTPIFDLNGDKLFNEDDKVEVEGEKVVPVGIYVGRGKGSKPVLHKNILFITTTGDGVVALGDDTNSGQEFFAQKINIKNQTVRLEAWRHK
jgi:type IV pilus assembly protein PilY1